MTVSQLPTGVIEAFGRPVPASEGQQIVDGRPSDVYSEPESTSQSTLVESVEADSNDSLMAEWDAAIWAEESAAIQPVEDTKSESIGWLAGLAAFAPSVLRRRRKQD